MRQIRTKNKEPGASKVLKQKQYCVAVLLPLWFRKLADNLSRATLVIGDEKVHLLLGEIHPRAADTIFGG